MLVDKNGKIVGHNMSDDEIDFKLQELLGSK